MQETLTCRQLAKTWIQTYGLSFINFSQNGSPSITFWWKKKKLTH